MNDNTTGLTTKQGIYPVPQNVLDLIINPAKVIGAKDIQRIFGISVCTAQVRFTKCRKALGKTLSDSLTIYQYYEFYKL